MTLVRLFDDVRPPLGGGNMKNQSCCVVLSVLLSFWAVHAASPVVCNKLFTQIINPAGERQNRYFEIPSLAEKTDYYLYGHVLEIPDGIELYWNNEVEPFVKFWIGGNTTTTDGFRFDCGAFDENRFANPQDPHGKTQENCIWGPVIWENGQLKNYTLDQIGNGVRFHNFPDDVMLKGGYAKRGAFVIKITVEANQPCQTLRMVNLSNKFSQQTEWAAKFVCPEHLRCPTELDLQKEVYCSRSIFSVDNCGVAQTIWTLPNGDVIEKNTYR